MKVTPLRIPEVVLLEPQVFEDDRGFLYESYNARRFAEALGRPVEFVQENHSRSGRNVLRGLHYQIQKAQAKLVRVIQGEIFDVAVDLRRDSPTFGAWVGETLAAENKRELWLPAGFAHGFLVLSEHAEVIYKTTNYWAPEHERCIAWNDPQLNISWPLTGAPTLSARDQKGTAFADSEVYASGNGLEGSPEA